MTHFFRAAFVCVATTLMGVLVAAERARAACSQGMLCNITAFPDINSFVAGALKVLVTVSIPIIGFFIVYSGFLLVFAQGKEAALTKAKKSLLYVIIGAGLVLGAWVLATIIGSTVSQITG